MSDAHRFVVWGMDQRNEIADPNAQYSSAWTKVVKASDYDALAAENALLREALNDYGAHRASCQWWMDKANKHAKPICDCGFASARAAVQPSPERT